MKMQILAWLLGAIVLGASVHVGAGPSLVEMIPGSIKIDHASGMRPDDQFIIEGIRAHSRVRFFEKLGVYKYIFLAAKEKPDVQDLYFEFRALDKSLLQVMWPLSKLKNKNSKVQLPYGFDVMHFVPIKFFKSVQPYQEDVDDDQRVQMIADAAKRLSKEGLDFFVKNEKNQSPFDMALLAGSKLSAKTFLTYYKQDKRGRLTGLKKIEKHLADLYRFVRFLSSQLESQKSLSSQMSAMGHSTVVDVKMNDRLHQFFAEIIGGSNKKVFKAPKSLYTKYAEQTFRNYSRHTALEVAIDSGNYEAAQFFMNNGVSFYRVLDVKGNTAYMTLKNHVDKVLDFSASYVDVLRQDVLNELYRSYGMNEDSIYSLLQLEKETKRPLPNKGRTFLRLMDQLKNMDRIYPSSLRERHVSGQVWKIQEELKRIPSTCEILLQERFNEAQKK